MQLLHCVPLLLLTCLSCLASPAATGPAELAAPPSAAPSTQPASAVKASEQELRFETIADGVHLIWTPTFPEVERRRAKVVVVEFDSFTALIEAPWDDRTVRRILRTIEQRIPNKPLRFVMHTHHHDHSIYAVDPLLASGATLVTSAWNLEELVKLSADEAALRRRVLLVKDRFEISDGSQRLVVHLLKRGTPPEGWEVPTPEYMVFEMAEQQALVTGCLYNKPKERHEVINQRKRTLAAFLKEKDIPAELLIPTNTTSEGGFEDVCTRKMLEETLIEGLDPVESSQRFAAMTPEEMRSRRAEIAQELQQRKVGAFDMLVCQSRMVADKRPAHALVWLEIACELHPNDPYVWYEAGCRAFELSQPEQAERYWTRAVEAAHDAVEREDLRRDIAAMRAAKK